MTNDAKINDFRLRAKVGDKLELDGKTFTKETTGVFIDITPKTKKNGKTNTGTGLESEEVSTD